MSPPAGLLRAPQRVRRAIRAIPSILAVIGTLLVMAPPPATAAPDNKSLFHSIGAPGLAIIEFTDEGIVRETYFGTDGDANPINRDSVFPWGSISASITAAATFALAEQHRLDVTTPVADILTELRGSELDCNNVTVLHLVQHTAGLPINLNTGETTTDGVIAAVAELTGLPQPGTHSYSNVGYSLLQAILERTTNRPIGEILNGTVGTRNHAGPFIADPKSFRKRVPHGYQPFFHTKLPVEVEPWDSAVGAAFIAGSNEQLARYATWQLRQHRTQQLPSGAPRAPITPKQSYGSGLYYETAHRTNNQQIEYVYHTGSAWGFTSYIGFVPSDNRGLIILTNEFGLRTQYDQRRRNDAQRFIANYFQFAHANQFRVFPTDLLILCAETLTVLALLAASARSAWKWRSPAPLLDARAAFRRTTIPLLSGIGAALALYYGTTELTAYGHAELSVGAPDISCMFWAILVEIHLLTAIVVLREITWARRLLPR